MKPEFSEVLIPGMTRVSAHSSSSPNKWVALLATMFVITVSTMVVFYELRLAKFDVRISVLEEELNSVKMFEQYYETEFGNFDDEDDDDDDDEDHEEIQLKYGEIRLNGEPSSSQGRSKRQIPTPTQTVFDPDVERTADGVPILDNSYLDRVGVVPTAGYRHYMTNAPPPTPQQDSEGLRLYESLVATGGRGEPRSSHFYPQSTDASPILPHHRTSAAWVEKPETSRGGGLQLKSGDSSSGPQFADDIFYTRSSGSRSAASSQTANSHRIATSSVTGPTAGGVTGEASSSYSSSSGSSGSSSNYLNSLGAGGNTVINRASRVPATGNTVINRASRVPATGDFLYPQNSRTRAIQYPPLKRLGQGDGEVVARVLQDDKESDTDSARPSHRAAAQAHLGETAGAHAESRRTYKAGRRGQANHNQRRYHGGKVQRKEVGDTGSFDSDEVNIVKAEAWVEGQKSVAAHYVADASNYTTAHRHYEGNGRLKNADGIFSSWKPSDWMAGNEATKNAFSLSSTGVLTIRQAGLYYIYAQIHYIDEHDINSFSVNLNSSPFLQCTTMTETYNSGSKSNTCFTAGVTYLKENDRIVIRDVEVNRYSILKPEKSFFGLMRISGDSGGLHKS